MECIKRGQRPTWIPQPGFKALRDQEDALLANRKLKSHEEHLAQQVDVNTTQNEPKQHPHIGNSSNQDTDQIDIVEQPPSALHSGDFADENSLQSTNSWADPADLPGLALSTSGLDASPPSWFSASPRPISFNILSHVQAADQIHATVASRRRAPSLGSSLSSSFVMRTPTSPLVQATSHLDLELRLYSERPFEPIASSSNPRRRTMPPSSFQALSMTPIETLTPNFSRPFAPALRREASLPTQRHLSRRSLTSVTYQPRSGPQTPLHHGRRQSLSSEIASRRRTSMVGSFEESILRGRMSTPPSKPLDFVAQIGVMGKGKCASSLKCPPHVSVPFPAVFYSYPASAGPRSVSDDTPSPYVGTVNLDEHLRAVNLVTNRGKKASAMHDDEGDRADDALSDALARDPNEDKLHVGGAYRVPQQGQLQIIIKNPNKTAVKLFLVPYDLTGLEAGQKTFVRQKSYSSGPIIENVLGDKKSVNNPFENKDILRYLIHLKFCCPARNRYYLYDDIRIVFANRFPDGKEKLRNEVHLPEPRFSVWKSFKPKLKGVMSKSTLSSPVANTFEVGSPSLFGDMDDFLMPERSGSPSPSARVMTKERLTPPPALDRNKEPYKSAVLSADHSFFVADTRSSFDFSSSRPRNPSEHSTLNGSLSPVTGFEATTPLRNSPIPWRSPLSASGSNRGFSPLPAEPGNGLLSKQFRQLNEKQGS